MKRTYVYRIISVVVLMTLIIGATIKVNEVLSDKEMGSVNQFECFYAQDKDTVDVLLVGSSRVFCNVDPNAMWENYGISAYDLATSVQPISASYYAIKEALKTQHPKIIFVEYSQILKDEDATGDFVINHLYGGMKLDENKIEGLLDHGSESTFFDHLFEISENHTRYNLINKETFTADDFAQYPVSGKKGFKGGADFTHKVTFDGYSPEVTVTDKPITERIKADINRINDLCEQNGIKLVMLWTPDIMRDTYPEIEAYIDECGITRLNCNDYRDEMGMDPQNDFIERGHLNIYGSMKVGAFLGDFAKQYCDLADHRGDEKYHSWDESLAYRNHHFKNVNLTKETGLGLFFNYFPDENYVAIVSLIGDYYSQFVGQEDVLRNVFCNHEAYTAGGTFVVGTGSGEVYYYENQNPPFWHSDFNNNTISIETGEDGVVHVLVDDVDYTVHKESSEDDPITNGIQVVVYDKLEQKVVDAVCFDADRDFAITRNTSE